MGDKIKRFWDLVTLREICEMTRQDFRSIHFNVIYALVLVFWRVKVATVL